MSFSRRSPFQKRLLETLFLVHCSIRRIAGSGQGFAYLTLLDICWVCLSSNKAKPIESNTSTDPNDLIAFFDVERFFSDSSFFVSVFENLVRLLSTTFVLLGLYLLFIRKKVSEESWMLSAFTANTIIVLVLFPAQNLLAKLRLFSNPENLNNPRFLIYAFDAMVTAPQFVMLAVILLTGSWIRFDKLWFMRGVGSLSPVVMFVEKMIIVLTYFLDLKDLGKTSKIILYSIRSAILFLILIRMIIHRRWERIKMQIVFSFVIAFVTMISVFRLKAIFYPENIEFTQLLIAIGISIVAAVCVSLRHSYTTLVLEPDRMRTLRFVCCVLDNLSSNGKIQNNNLMIHSFFDQHRKSCDDPTCFCYTDMIFNASSETDVSSLVVNNKGKLIRRILLFILESAAEKSKSEKLELVLDTADFCFTRMNNVVKSAILLGFAEESKGLVPLFHRHLLAELVNQAFTRKVKERFETEDIKHFVQMELVLNSIISNIVKILNELISTMQSWRESEVIMIERFIPAILKTVQKKHETSQLLSRLQSLISSSRRLDLIKMFFEREIMNQKSLNSIQIVFEGLSSDEKKIKLKGSSKNSKLIQSIFEEESIFIESSISKSKADQIKRVSKNFESQTLFSEEDVLGKGISELMIKEFGETHDILVKEVLRTGNMYQVNSHKSGFLRRKDGEVFSISMIFKFELVGDRLSVFILAYPEQKFEMLIITDQLGFVLGISHAFCKEVEIDLENFQKKKINLAVFNKDLLQFLPIAKNAVGIFKSQELESDSKRSIYPPNHFLINRPSLSPSLVKLSQRTFEEFNNMSPSPGEDKENVEVSISERKKKFRNQLKSCNSRELASYTNRSGSSTFSPAMFRFVELITMIEDTIGNPNYSPQLFKLQYAETVMRDGNSFHLFRFFSTEIRSASRSRNTSRSNQFIDVPANFGKFKGLHEEESVSKKLQIHSFFMSTLKNPVNVMHKPENLKIFSSVQLWKIFTWKDTIQNLFIIAMISALIFCMMYFYSFHLNFKHKILGLYQSNTVTYWSYSESLCSAYYPIIPKFDVNWDYIHPRFQGTEIIGELLWGTVNSTQSFAYFDQLRNVTMNSVFALKLFESRNFIPSIQTKEFLLDRNFFELRQLVFDNNFRGFDSLQNLLSRADEINNLLTSIIYILNMSILGIYFLFGVRHLQKMLKISKELVKLLKAVDSAQISNLIKNYQNSKRFFVEFFIDGRQQPEVIPEIAKSKVDHKLRVWKGVRKQASKTIIFFFSFYCVMIAIMFLFGIARKEIATQNANSLTEIQNAGIDLLRDCSFDFLNQIIFKERFVIRKLQNADHNFVTEFPEPPSFQPRFFNNSTPFAEKMKAAFDFDICTQEEFDLDFRQLFQTSDSTSSTETCREILANQSAYTIRSLKQYVKGRLTEITLPDQNVSDHEIQDMEYVSAILVATRGFLIDIWQTEASNAIITSQISAFVFTGLCVAIEFGLRYFLLFLAFRHFQRFYDEHREVFLHSVPYSVLQSNFVLRQKAIRALKSL